MKQTLLPTLALLATSALAQGTSSPCPYNYPAELNTTTSHSGLILTIASNNPATSNRALQLRPNPSSPGLFFVGIDASSPVLLSNFASGAWKAQARDISNQLYDLGPTAYLDLRDTTNGTERFTVGFGNATGEVEKEWNLLGASETGGYGVYHNTPLETVNGFVLCKADNCKGKGKGKGKGEWYQLFYYNYKNEPAEFPECEFVGVETTVAARIYNGECDIGGEVAGEA
ncbi:hypothetical protein F4808DRAFT_246642 [Astrocystis sublimbata]|nr:hypothetical protein F4808DRAFT_246642 [Astrocystis sublimbata]